jgi:hypothetical protein
MENSAADLCPEPERGIFRRYPQEFADSDFRLRGEAELASRICYTDGRKCLDASAPDRRAE